MKATELKKGIYWVGGIDWDLRNFHGYLTQRGSTYNAYLIVDEKIVLIDTVKHYLYDEMIERISEIIDPSKIDMVIAQHVEMDHSGGLPKLMEVIGEDTTIVTPAMGQKGLKAHYKKDWNFQVVKPGDSINIGSRDLTFWPVPMVHWPDNMMTYSVQDKILFSNDAFGQHLATSERFDHEYPFDTLMFEAKKYYANIVLPYDSQTKNALKMAAGAGEIEMIAPSHGLIWKDHISDIIGKYQKWANNDTEERAVIVYDSMWGSTKLIAQALASELEEKNIHFTLTDLKVEHISDVMTSLTEAKYIFVGSPTLNNQMLPTVSAFLTYMKGLKPQKRVGLAFGSFGWGGQSIGYVEKELQETGFEMLPSVKINYIPDADNLKKVVKEALSGLPSS